MLSNLKNVKLYIDYKSIFIFNFNYIPSVGRYILNIYIYTLKQYLSLQLLELKQQDDHSTSFQPLLFDNNLLKILNWLF